MSFLKMFNQKHLNGLLMASFDKFDKFVERMDSNEPQGKKPKLGPRSNYNWELHGTSSWNGHYILKT